VKFGLAVAVGVGLILPASASATTFCVPAFHAACPNNGTNVAQANLETAISSNASDGIADTVIVAAGHTYTDTQSLDPSGSDDLLILGGGPSTVITTNSVSNIYVVNLAAGGNGREITMQDLTIKIPASLPDNQGAGLQMSSDHLIGVDFRSENPGSSAFPSIIGGATVEGGTYAGANGGSLFTAIRADGNATANVEISGIDVTASVGVAIGAATGSIHIDRSHFKTTTAAIDAGQGANIGVTNSLIETTSGIALSATAAGAANSTVSADGVTAFDQSGANNVPLSAIVQGAASTGTATINFRDSIAYDYGPANAFTRNSQGVGQANINIAYSNIPAAGSNNGPGAVTRTSSISADPKFANAPGGDYTLLPTSPSVDTGDPASVLTSDFDGLLRPQDANGDGNALVDQGAFERADTTAPNTVIDTGPAAGSTSASSQATFTFHGSPAGDVAKLQCKLDGGAFADCTSPKTFSGLGVGSHTVSFRAEDAVGNQDASPATRTFTVTSAPPDTKAPQTTIDFGPGKRAIKGKVKFAFSASEAGSSFECSLVKKGKPPAFKPCNSPQSYKLKRTKKTQSYAFLVRASDKAGNTDPTPASGSFKVKKKQRR
jgi:hypothetical protein